MDARKAGSIAVNVLLSNTIKKIAPALANIIVLVHHIHLGKTHFARSRKIKSLIDKGEITLGGNKQLKIYGTLACKSGKRMKTANRVFFISEQEAINEGYRPCRNCMNKKYKQWKTKK